MREGDMRAATAGLRASYHCLYVDEGTFIILGILTHQHPTHLGVEGLFCVRDEFRVGFTVHRHPERGPGTAWTGEKFLYGSVGGGGPGHLHRRCVFGTGRLSLHGEIVGGYGESAASSRPVMASPCLTQRMSHAGRPKVRTVRSNAALVDVNE